MIKITDYMTRPVITTKVTDTIRAAVMKMDNYNIGSLVVMNDKKVAGIVTERDILRKAIARKMDIEKVTVNRIMTSTVQTIRATGSLIEVASIMKSHSMRRIVVIDKNGKPVGVVTSKDLIDILCT
jgi:CBS domain-containing protein